MKTSTKGFAIATLTAAALGLAMSASVHADEYTTRDRAADAMDSAQQSVSDTWITGKVKSSFVAESALSAMEIGVETKQGVVTLSGVVATEAERDLAISAARNIEGVQDVSADALQVAE